MNKFYVTTPLYYVNAAPHLGHAYADVIADVLARAARIRGAETFFLTGTDEHGAKVARSAEAASMDPRAFVDRQSLLFSRLADTLRLSHDEFIRTSDTQKHWPGVQKMWKLLRDGGDIYKGNYEGLYCVGHEAFITEKDLVNGKCPDHDTAPERICEENYFFRLSEYAESIRAFVISDELRILPASRKNEVVAMIDEGVEDISFSRPARDVPWGIPVPDDDMHVMYVWCDALTNYISALGFGKDGDAARNMAQFWPADVHVIGKDILRFHAIIWPAMLLAAGLPLPKTIFTHGLIMSGGQKMSKTISNVVDPVAIAEEYGVDALRCFLVSDIPTYEDGDFTIERFRESYTARLANGIGNLVSRIAVMIERYGDRVVERPSEALLEEVAIRQFVAEVATGEHMPAKGQDAQLYLETIMQPRYEALCAQVRLNEMAGVAWEVVRTCDRYIQDYEPFKLAADNPEKARAVLWNAAILLLGAARMLEPVMPDTASRIYQIFHVNWEEGMRSWTRIQAARPEPLFPRLPEDQEDSAVQK